MERAVDDAAEASLAGSSAAFEESATFSAAAAGSDLPASAAGARAASASDSAVEQHSFETAAQYCDRIEHLQNVARLSTTVMTNLISSQIDPHHVTYATAVAATAIVALTAASMEFSSAISSSAPIESSNNHYVAIGALAALLAAEKIDFKPSKGPVPRRAAVGGRGAAAGRLGFQDRRGGARGVQTDYPPAESVIVAGGATKRPLAASFAAPAAKFPRKSTIVGSDKETPITDVATARSSLENPTAVTTHATPTPVVRPVFIPPYVTTFIATTLANTTAAGEAELSSTANATLALINALATVARARTNSGVTSALAPSMETAAAAAASAAIPQDSIGLAIEAIKDIAAPASSDAGLIDRLTVHLAKAAAATLCSTQAPAPSAGTGVARVVGFLGPQAGGAAAAASSILPHLTAGPASSAPGDDEEIKADDNGDKAKPE